MMTSFRCKGLVVSDLFAVLIIFVSNASIGCCKEKPSTRELLPDLDGFFVSSQRAETIRRELVEREDLVPTILQLLEERKATQRMIWLLEDLPFERGEQTLRKALDSKDRFVRSAACLVLGRLGDVRGVPILEEYLARNLSKPSHQMTTLYHDEEEGAIDALEALVEIDNPASDRVLESVLTHPSPILRFLAAQELARRNKESAVPVLLGLLNSTQQADSTCFRTPVYQEARRALQNLTYVYDMSEFTDLDRNMKSFCDTLHRGRDQELTEEKAAVTRQWKASWQTWWETHKNQTRAQWSKESFAWAKDAISQDKTRDQAIKQLLLIGDKEAIDLLFQLINDPKTPPDIKTRAVHAMWFKDNRLLEEPLRHVLEHHPLGDVRSAAAYALNQFRSKASGEALVRALADPQVMEQAVGSLRFYPYPEFLDALLPLLKDSNADVRDSARIAVSAITSERKEDVLLKELDKNPALMDTLAILRSLRWRGTEKSLPQLVKLLRHDNGKVRSAAVKAIENIAQVEFDYSERDDANLKCRTVIEQWWDARQKER